MEYINFAKDEPSLFCFLFMCANAFEEIKRYSQNIELYEKSGFVRFKKTKTENKGFVYLEKIENLENRVKVSLKNLSNSVDQNDETVFYIKYEDLINEINYIDV